MSWFKNQWDKGGAFYPKFLDNRNSLSGNPDPNTNKFSSEREKPQFYVAKSSAADYFITFPRIGDNFVAADLMVNLLRAGMEDEVIDSYHKTIYSYSVPAFIGDTLEIDDDYTKNDSPFTEPLLNSRGKKLKVDKQVVTALDCITKVLRANLDKLSIVIIGNHEGVTEGNIYKTAEDKKNRIKLNITLSSFMKQRAEIYQATFFSGISSVITMGADDKRNMYHDDHNLSIPANAKKFLKPGKNLEGISVIFLLKAGSDDVRH